MPAPQAVRLLVTVERAIDVLTDLVPLLRAVQTGQLQMDAVMEKATEAKAVTQDLVQQLSMENP